MMTKRMFLTTLVISITCLAMSHGFSIVQKSIVVGGLAKPLQTTTFLKAVTTHAAAARTPMNGYYSSTTTTRTTTSSSSSSSLTMSSSSSDDDDQPKKLMEFGQGRGVILQVIVLSICVWMFSIPTEFRRAYFCGTPSCVENRSRCNDCVTVDEWTAGIADYYKNGGGIHFDFSIDPKTKAQWSNLK